MSKMVFLSDPHLMWDNPIGRLDDIVETQKKKWTFILDYCKSINAPLIMSGDVFDSPRSWRTLFWFTNLYMDYHDVNMYSVRGQHEVYFRNFLVESTSFGVLQKVGYIKLLTDVPTEIDGVFLYGSSFNESIPVPKDSLAHNILVIHRMITPRPLWIGQTEYTDASYFLAKEAIGYDTVLAGDAHIQYLIQSSNGKIICNTGPLLRAEASKEMIEHHPCIFVYDTETRSIETVEVPHEPAENVLSVEHLERKKETDLMLNNFIESVKNTDVKTGMSFIDVLWDFVKVNNISDGVQKIMTETMEEADIK